MPLYEYTYLKTPCLCSQRQGLRFLLLLTVHICRVHPPCIHWHMKMFMELVWCWIQSFMIERYPMQVLRKA